MKWKRFIRYTMVGVGTLLVDLGLLYIAVSIGGVAYYIATPISFLIAVSLNYAISREFVFKGSERRWHAGYAYFILAAVLGAAVTTVLVAGLVEFVRLYYLAARIITAGIVGLGNYFFNLYINFRVVGQHDA